MDPSNAVDNKQPIKRRRLSSKNIGRDTKNDDVPIRTVCADGIESNRVHEIKDFFGQFGKIEMVAIQFEDVWTRCCLIQFKRKKDAAKVLFRNFPIGFKVKAADPWHQPDHPLLKAPAQDSKLNIVNALNDDCLQKIFKYLKLSSLTNVAGVCVRFNEQAKITFASEHKHLDLYHEFNHRRDLIKIAIKHFGKDIQSLCVWSKLFKTEAHAIRSIGQHCGPKLKQLEFDRFQFQTDLQALRPIFAGIEQLKLQNCAASIGLDRSMAECVELKSLTLSQCDNIGQDYEQYIMRHTFPKLQTFSLDYIKFSGETFENFLNHNQTLINLSIKSALISRALRSIGQYAENLQELALVSIHLYEDDNNFRNDLTFIGQLHSLKRIQLDLETNPNVPVLEALIAGNVPIECMEICFQSDGFDNDNAIDCLSQLKQIKKLQIKTFTNIHRVTDADVIKLAKHLPVLEELHLEEFNMSCIRSDYGYNSLLSTVGLRTMLMHSTKLKLLTLKWIDSIKIDIDDHEAILSTVQNRKEKVAFVIEIHGDGDHVDVPSAILAENRNTFDIKAIRLA